ncbi:MAG TPA: extracellular solute-binding protein [Methylomirabilota bacterium]|jgi:multiple sugar transport system substrate-binding protein|nr:extracellular solute-binding protein [Methylomirabilota bacterium]
MSDLQSAQNDSTPVSRRGFIKAAGAGVAGASLLTMLDARQAPAQIKGTNLRILVWSHFVPAYDTWFDDFSKKWGEKNGVKVRVDHIPHLELPARYAAEFAAGAGHDLIYFVGQILTGQYYKNLIDLSDIADGLSKKYGTWMEGSKSAAQVAGRWFGIPDFFIAIPVLWRKDLFDSVGLGAPNTWEDLRKAGRLLKAKGHPTGMQFSHCNDANHNWRALMYGFGVKETDPSGQNITIDSKEMREALKFAKAMYDEGMTPEVFSWDDASDNRFLASGVGCWVHDAISAFRTTEDTNPKVFKETYCLPEAAGPAGRWNVGEPNVWAIWKFSKNIAGAKEFIQGISDSQKEAMLASRGYNMPFMRGQYAKPMPGLGNDAKLAILQEQDKITAFFGHPGPMTPQAQEVLTTFVVPDMFTRVARGADLEETMKWGVGEIRRIYAKHKAS